jgi:hypothetical protein
MDNKVFDFHEIKTFEDACKRLGISAESLLVDSLGDTEAFLQANALYKLLIIQKAMNSGDFNDTSMYRFYPFWRFFKEEWMEQMTQEQRKANGIRSIASYSKNLYTGISQVGIMKAPYQGAYISTSYIYAFCFNSEEAARYVGRQFEDLFFRYYGIKVKA